MENGTKIILSTSINVQPNPSIKRSIVCKYACCRICLYDNRYYVQIVKYTFNNSILFHRRDIQEPDVIVKPDREYDMSFVRQDG